MNGTGKYVFTMNGVSVPVYVHPPVMYIGPQDEPLPETFIEGHDIDGRSLGPITAADIPKDVYGLVGLGGYPQTFLRTRPVAPSELFVTGGERPQTCPYCEVQRVRVGSAYSQASPG